MREFAISRNNQMLPLRILAVSIDEVPYLLVEMGIEGIVEVLQYDEGENYEWIEEPDPQDN